MRSDFGGVFSPIEESKLSSLALKGHGFSRAEGCNHRFLGFSPRGMVAAMLDQISESYFTLFNERTARR